MTDVFANWLWQGVVIALVSELGLRWLPRVNPAARYTVWATALAMVVSLPAFALFASAELQSANGAFPPAYVINVAEVVAPSSSTIAIVWALWAAVGLTRVVGAILALRHAKRKAKTIAPSREARLPGWTAVRDGGRPARLAVSRHVDSAAVFGLSRPIIAIAPDLLDHLDDRDLDRVVLHEWAHVQRYDDLALLLQGAVLAIAGFHPAVWWLNRRLNLERELACDETAARISGSAKAYAACLASMADTSSSSRPALLPAIFTRTQLRVRVERLLANPPASPWRSRGALALALPGLIVLGSALASRPLFTDQERVSGGERSAVQLSASKNPMRLANGETAGVSAQPMGRKSSNPRTTSGTLVPLDRNTDTRLSRVVRPEITEVALPATAALAVSRSPETNAQVDEPADPPDLLSTAPSYESPQLTVYSSLAPYSPLATAASSTSPGLEPPPATTPTPWSAATATALRVGSDSERAARATAGMFSRFGQQVARSFSSQ